MKTKLSIDPLYIAEPYLAQYSSMEHRNTDYDRCLLWKALVDAYSGFGLTAPEKDKLVAISGLARRIGRADDYLAGLWREFLPEQLLWHTVEPASSRDDIRAPAWSWASMNHKVNMYIRLPEVRERCSLVASLLDAEVSHVSQDPFGQVQSGFVRVIAPLAKVTIRDTPEKSGRYICWLGKSLSVVSADMGKFPDDTAIYCLSILKFSMTTKFRPGDMEGILFEPAKSTPGHYYRRGKFSVSQRNSGGVSHNLESFTLELRSLLGCELYEKYMGVDDMSFHRYQFSIV